MARARMELVLDCVEPQLLEEFWRAALGYRSLVSLDEIVVLVPEDDLGPPFLLQKVPEPKGGKNRMHIDIIREDLEGDVTRLEGLGARRLHEGLQKMGPTRWIVLADPDDNEFCVSSGVEW